jgi:alpha-amylase
LLQEQYSYACIVGDVAYLLQIKILKAERSIYAAEIDEKLTIKIGPEHFEPSGPQNWIVAAEGQDYKIWEVSP